MAYMSQQKKKQLAPNIKEICQKHGIKATLSVRNHSTLVLTLRSGSIDFGNDIGIRSVNVYHYRNQMGDNQRAVAFLDQVLVAMNDGNHDRSNIMIDYFDVGWYTDIKVGLWNKPYVLSIKE